jgi:hypothetical protein
MRPKIVDVKAIIHTVAKHPTMVVVNASYWPHKCIFIKPQTVSEKTTPKNLVVVMQLKRQLTLLLGIRNSCGAGFGYWGYAKVEIG